MKTTLILIALTTLFSTHAFAGQCPEDMPASAPLRNRDATFNSRYWFQRANGGICYRPLTGGDWLPIALPPELEGQVSQISADDDDLVALGPERRIFTMKGALEDATKFKWRSRWGAPLWFGSGMSLAADVLAWDISYLSPSNDHDYIDRAGNKHWVGSGVTTLYALRGDRQRITYLDPWLPADESFEVCGPKRGRFKMSSLAASGSTIFVMNERGDMFTRRYDFDMAGADWVFFFYSWNDQSRHDSIFRQLPVEPWQRQPKIHGQITGAITIVKQGLHVVHRLLRVEGVKDGVTGFWQKDLADADWTFFYSGFPLSGDTLAGNSDEDTSEADLGDADDHAYSGKVDGRYGITVSDFNPYCSPAKVEIDFGEKEKLVLRLHTTETIRQGKRERGLTESPLPLRAAIEVPDGTLARLDALGPLARKFVKDTFGSKSFSRAHVEVTRDRLSIRKLFKLHWVLNSQEKK
jgi:hypothetical protein